MSRWARSPSQLSQYERCPKSYEFKYIRKYNLAASWAIRGRAYDYKYNRKYNLAASWAIRGRAVHAALEYNFVDKIQTGLDRPVAECLELFHDTVHTAFSPMASEEVVLFNGESEERIRKEGAAALSTYLRDLAPGIQPLMVEESLEMTLPSGLRLRGRVDLVDDQMQIRDAKTVTDRMDPGSLHYQAQPALYGALVHAKTGHYPRVIFDVVSLGRAKEPQPKVASLPFQVNEALVTARLADLEAVDAQINAGLFPRRPSEMNCSRCVYKNACWQGMLPPPLEAPDFAPLLQTSLDALAR